MARDVKVIISVDDQFSKKSLEKLRGLRTQAVNAVNNQRKQLNKNWHDWAKGINELKEAGFTGFGGPGGGGGGGAGKAAKAKKKAKAKNPYGVASRRAKQFQRANNTPGKMALNSVKASAKAASRLVPSGVAAATATAVGVAAKAIPVAAIGYAAYKLAETANEGLAVMGGALNAMGGAFGSAAGSTLVGISENIGEAVFDFPGKATSAASRATTLAVSFAKAKVPLGSDALYGIAEFVFEETGWKKQRERRERVEMGEALGVIVKKMTDYGGG